MEAATARAWSSGRVGRPLRVLRHLSALPIDRSLEAGAVVLGLAKTIDGVGDDIDPTRMAGSDLSKGLMMVPTDLFR